MNTHDNVVYKHLINWKNKCGSFHYLHTQFLTILHQPINEDEQDIY